MEFYKNIMPYKVINYNDFVNHSGNKISSKAIIDRKDVEMRFFSAAKGEIIDKEIYNEESFFFCMSGELKIIYDDNKELILSSGEMMVLERNVYYGILAIEDVKYFNVLIK